MKSKTRLLIIIGLLLVALYVGFKFYCYNVYGRGEYSELSNVKITGKMTINHIDLDDSEYITFKNLKFKNIFDGYERLNEDTDTYKMILKSDEINRAIFIGIDDQYVYIINNNNEYKYLSNNVIKKENIKDDLDFVKYMEVHNDDEVKFFMTTRKQKQIHAVNEFKKYMLPTIEYVKEIDGYYRGYIFKTGEDIIDISILKDDKKYYFTFLGDFTEEHINEFMNSVVIE